MYRENDRLPARHRPEYWDEGHSTDIVSFPSSVQDKLDRAQELLRGDRPSEAMAALQQAGVELARTSPETFALLVASQMGVRRIAFEQAELDTVTVRTDRSVFGIRYAEDVQTTTTGKTVKRSISLA